MPFDDYLSIFYIDIYAGSAQTLSGRCLHRKKKGDDYKSKDKSVTGFIYREHTPKNKSVSTVSCANQGTVWKVQAARRKVLLWHIKTAMDGSNADVEANIGVSTVLPAFS